MSSNSRLLNNIKYKLHVKLHNTPPRNLNLPLTKEDINNLSDYEIEQLKQKKLAGKLAFDITNKNISLGSRHTKTNTNNNSSDKFYIPKVSGESFYKELSQELAKKNIPISFQYGSGKKNNEDVEELLEGIQTINIFDSNDEYDLLFEAISASKPSQDLLIKAIKRYNRYISYIDLTDYPEVKKRILLFLQYDCLNSLNHRTCFTLMKQIDSFIYNIVKE